MLKATGEPQINLADAVEHYGAGRKSRFLITCDHASNHVPEWVNGGDLGLLPEDMERHIAYDVGASGLSLALADCLGCPAILSRFSRLVIDPNRGKDDPTRIMQLYDGSIIPANRTLDAPERARREKMLYAPYHAALAAAIAAQAQDEALGPPVIIAIHSFTPQLKGRPKRPWHIGVLSSHDRRLAGPLLTSLEADGRWVVGDNEPYHGHLPGDSIDTHVLAKGHLHALIELRNDLIADAAGQSLWAGHLAHHLRAALAALEGIPAANINPTDQTKGEAHANQG